MKQILLLGAGLSTTSLIKYLLEHSEEFQWRVRIGDQKLKLVQDKINGHVNAEAFQFSVEDTILLESEVQKADVVISMLPARFHSPVATACLKFRKNMLTASYVPHDVKKLDEKIREAGLIFLNEIGLDPGIDHMSAMEVINSIQGKGGKLLLFKSSTGGLVAPGYDNNPWRYKFTWNPRNVVLAGQGISQFIRNGKYKYIPYNKLFERVENIQVLDYGEFEVYPNRDSLQYRSIYHLDEIPTMFRGTLRRPGYCKTWNILVQLGMTNNDFSIPNSDTMTYREFVNTFLAYDPVKPVEEKLCAYFNIKPDSPEMDRLNFLGLFENEKIGEANLSPAQILQKRLEEKWQLEEGDRDMIVMQHQFEYELNGKLLGKKSSMVVIGKDNQETSMAMTVGLPLAIATKMVLQGKIPQKGVVIPVFPEIYQPVLNELAEYGIRFVEEEYTPKS